MSDTDSILQGFLIAGFTTIGLCMMSYCIRKYRAPPSMKKSASMEELNGSDPIQVV